MDFRPGDWICTCGAHNYASKGACFQCRMPREAVTGQAVYGQQPQQQQPQFQPQAQYGAYGNVAVTGGNVGGFGNGGMYGDMGTDRDYYPPMRMGDYRDGFDYRQQAAAAPPAQPQPMLGDFSTHFPGITAPTPVLPTNWRPGDWLCTCGNHNYAIRTACGKCGKGKLGAGPSTGLPGNFRPGDWMCKCGNHNYQSRAVCGKCNEQKEAAQRVVPPQLAPNFQVGDWMCTCGAHNYQSKTVCYKCSLPKESALAELPNQAKASFRPGDWVCAGCKNHNYASRIVCGRCKGPKTVDDSREQSPTSAVRERSRSPKR